MGSVGAKTRENLGWLLVGICVAESSQSRNCYALALAEAGTQEQVSW